jgi:hypothetical protein
MPYSYEDGAFVIRDYDKASTFCSFLPGLAGVLGTPLWAFYVNRGQGICSFGINDKEGSILEFSPGNTALKRVQREGFRTFIRIEEYDCDYEAFVTHDEARRNMRIRPNSFTVEEICQKFHFTVHYYVLPGESFPALVRSCSLKNVSGEALTVKLLDGLPEIIPFGISTNGYKFVSNLNKSWAESDNLKNNLPFFFTRSIPGDKTAVEEASGGYFYASVYKNKLVKPIIDPVLIFDCDTAYAKALRFHGSAPETQITANKYCCGFTPLKAHLLMGEFITWDTMIGFASDRKSFDAKKFTQNGWFDEKFEQAAEEGAKITEAITTRSANPYLDGYFAQSYMDNVLRGGKPYIFDGGDKVVHLFSRKHGDPERDYNFFSLAAEYFSQGNGNFRDVCQNRRNDVYFDPEAGEFNIWMFFSLMQADGFNPLEIRGTSFSVLPGKEKELAEIIAASGCEALTGICAKPFTAGQVVNASGNMDVLTSVLGLCRQNIEAVFGEGYWIDHWTYLMDLVENYLDVFPDKKQALLFNNKKYRYFVSPVRIKPRKEVYEENNGALRRYTALERLEGRPQADWLKKADGEVYETSLFIKMLSLAAVKYASLDPEGIGLDCDGGRPGWNDAMNGLPAIFGSGVGESYELMRLFDFILAVEDYTEIVLPKEIAEFLQILLNVQMVENQFKYWDYVAKEKENFREKLLQGISGEEVSLYSDCIREMFTAFTERLQKGLDKAEGMAENGIIPTYLTYEPEIGKNGFPTSFACRPMTEFLEGPVRKMKVEFKNQHQARAMYEAIKASDIYDRKLKMYKTSGSLERYGYEIGRIRAFTPGWLERESVFLHMSLKYLLALLKCGLHEPFFESMTTSLPPFLDPGVYGRSPMEISTFIASGVNPDPEVVGKGFVARLSGSTAESLSIWKLMFWGARGFYQKQDGTLAFAFNPVLPEWLFDEKNEISFTLLGRVMVTYYNPGRKNTYGGDGARVSAMRLTYENGETAKIEGCELTGDDSYNLRERKIKNIYVTLV